MLLPLVSVVCCGSARWQHHPGVHVADCGVSSVCVWGYNPVKDDRSDLTQCVLTVDYLVLAAPAKAAPAPEPEEEEDMGFSLFD